MPHYAFCCRTCGLEFEVSRSMSDAGRDAACPVDGGVADRLFTAPMTSVRQGDGPAFRSGRERESRLVVAVLSESRSERPRRPGPAPPPRHVLPAGSSKPTRFRHFGHWHPAGTAPHEHPPRRPPPAKPAPPPGV